MTEEQSKPVAQMKRASPDFTTLHQLAMLFRGTLCDKDPDRFVEWMNHTHSLRLYQLWRFVLTLRNDMAAVRKP